MKNLNCGTDCTAVLFDLNKISKALFEIVKFLNILDLALSIISKKCKKQGSNESSHTSEQAIT